MRLRVSQHAADIRLANLMYGCINGGKSREVAGYRNPGHSLVMYHHVDFRLATSERNYYFRPEK